MLEKDKIKGNYSTDKHNVLGEFYLPTLKHATSYDRAVGYFSSKALLHIIQGLDGLINNGGKMRLVVGSPLTKEEYNAIKNNTPSSVDTREKIFNEFREKWNELIHEDLDELNKYRLDVFSWLAKTNKLEIKFALRKKGLFHKKIGVIKSDNFTVVFNGSLNETESAFEDNSENFDVYRDWRIEAFEDHGKPHIQEFEDVWAGKENDTITFGIPSNCYDDIKDHWSSEGQPKSNLEKKAAKKIAEMFKEKEEKEREEMNFEYDYIKPRFPKQLGGNPYKLNPHQDIAIQKWKDNDYKGIMALATGAGKTITSIHSAVELNQNNKLVLIVAVPYKVLAEQWVDVLKLFNINPIKCWSPYNWNTELPSEINNFNLFEDREFLGIVVVNATLKKTKFQEHIKKILPEQMMFIGDECHHHGEKGLKNKLPNANYKLGLSATPWSKREHELKNTLESYYGKEVAKYTLKEAMDEGILTQYKYNIYPVSLNVDESDAYEEISKSILKMLAIQHNGGKINETILQNLIFKRSRLLDSLEGKFIKLEEILQDKQPSAFTLFYCGSGSVESDDDAEDEDENNEQSIRSISKITSILHKFNWHSSHFTSKETATQRARILDSFKTQAIDAIAAIKVLDEGFDVPMCREAYITASSRNERQFIQRRGRILRTSEGKTEAVIHDFVILHDNHTDPIYRTLAKNEMERVAEFYNNSSNKKELLPYIEKIISQFDLIINEEGDYAI